MYPGDAPWDDTGPGRRPRPRKRALGTLARRRVAPAGSGRGALATPGTRRGAASGTGRSRARPLKHRRKIHHSYGFDRRLCAVAAF